MTIKELYNALEKAIDSGEATLETEVYCSCYDKTLWTTVSSHVDDENDFIIVID